MNTPIQLNEKEWNRFQKNLKNPPKANKALKKLLKRIKDEMQTLWK